VKSVLVLVALAGTAAGDRPFHGSVAAGGALVLTGDRGDRQRAEITLELKPKSRYGGLLAWRSFDQDRHGLVTAGIVYEGAAARPRLVVDLHADLGADLDERAPVVGGGIRTTLTIVGPLGVVLDSGAYLVIDGVDDSRLQLQGSLLLALRW
jgi:hypothetical protein